MCNFKASRLRIQSVTMDPMVLTDTYTGAVIIKEQEKRFKKPLQSL